MSRGTTTSVYLSDMECSHSPKEGPSRPVEGWLYTLPLEMTKMKITKKPELTARAQGCAPPRNKGEAGGTPKCHPGYWVK